MKKMTILCYLFLFFGCATHTTPYSNSKKTDFVNLLNSEGTEKTILKGGMSGTHLYKITDGEETYVIRNIENRSNDDKAREIQAQKIASEQDYGPHLFYSDDAKGIIVMSFIQQSEQKLERKERAQKLAFLLKKIHHGPLFLNHLSIVEQIKNIFHSVKSYPKDIDIKKVSLLIQSFEKTKNSKKFKKTATHRDLNPNNIIFNNGEFKVIDFENAGNDDPYFDIATILAFNPDNGTFEHDFLHSYFERDLSQNERRHLNIMKKAVFTFYGLQMLLKVSPNMIHQDAPVRPLENVYLDLDSKKLSLDNDMGRLIFAKSLLNKAIDLKV